MLVLKSGSASCFDEESTPIELLDISNFFSCSALPMHLMLSLISLILLFNVD